MHDFMHLRPTQIQMRPNKHHFLAVSNQTEATLKFVVASVNEALGAPASQASITSVWAISATAAAVFFLAGQMVRSPGQALICSSSRDDVTQRMFCSCFILQVSSRSNRSEVTEVWWLRTVGPTFSKLLKLDLNISQVQNRRIIQYALD